MSRTINTRIISKHDTKARWDAAVGFIPLKGEIIIYEDYMRENDQDMPNIKIGDGLAYVQDLPFVVTIPPEIRAHINNHIIHITAEERAVWNHKIDCEDTVNEEELILYR